LCVVMAATTGVICLEFGTRDLNAENLRDEKKAKGKGKAKDKSALKAATGPLTADEKTLLALISRPGCYLRNLETRDKVDIGYPKLTREERAKLVLDQYKAGGRGKDVATKLYAVDAIVDMWNGEVTKYNKLYSQFPDQMRLLAFQATGMALSGKDIPSPFSKEFQAQSDPVLGWFDNLRSSKARESVIGLHMTISINNAVTAIEKDWMPFHKSDTNLSKDIFQIRALPGGQALKIDYVGEKPLTNVVLFSLVKQNPKGPKNKNQIPSEAIDAFNRSFGATDRQATDAMTILQASEAHSRMPKYAILFLPEWKPNVELMFEVGEMERGDALIGNTNTFTVYSDQGFLTSPDLKGFPVKPEQKRAK
jgi:hypothetical protein